MYKGKFENSPKASDSPLKKERKSRKNKQEQGSIDSDTPKKTRKVKTGTIVFYSILGAFILAFCIGLVIAMNALNDWLVRFEASQPTAKCETVFSELFQDPDWAQIYELDPGDVTAEDYVQYMEQKVGDAKLTFIETSAGLSGDKKYIVRCGTEKIATFTLTNVTPDSDIPDWQLGKVELFYQAELSVYIQAPADHIVLVNGQVLDDSYVIRTVSTEAQKYLPDGVYGYQTKELAVHNLLVEPEVQVLDAQSNPVELQYDSQARRYSVAIHTPEITEEHRQTLVTAAETYCKYMIRKTTQADLRKCFDSNSNIYQTITQSEIWLRNFARYELSEVEITDYYRYNDAYFSGRVVLTLNVTRWDGTVKDYQLDSTLFVKNENDQWLVWEMVNVNAQNTVVHVLLTYMSEDQVIHTEMTDAHSNKLSLPKVTAPEGKTFAGWFVKREQEDGSTAMELVFEPSQDGTVTISDQTVLEPMILYALYE